MSIIITDIAKEKLVENGVGSDGKLLRLNVKNGGCSGLKYDMLIDTESTSDDTILHENDQFKVVADKGSSLFLSGLTIDFSTDLIQGGFKLTNKMAKGSCGCGASFEPEQQ